MKNNTLKGIFWIIICMFAGASADIIMKNLKPDFHFSQLVFFRSFAVLLVLLIPWFLHKRKAKNQDFVKISKKNYCAMGALKVLSAASYISALEYVPLPIIGAIILAGTPLSMFLAIIFLNEKICFYKIMGLLGGLLGVLLIVRPGFVEVNYYIILPFLSTTFTAFYAVLAKGASSKVNIFDVAFYPLIFMSILTFPFAMFFWKQPDLIQFAFIFANAVAISIYLVTMAKAYSHADLTILAPFDFFYLLFLSIMAYVVYDEHIDIWTALGGLIIVMSGWYIIRKEKGKHIPQEVDIGH